MATNPPKGLGRIGAIKQREQVFNPQNQRYVKIDTTTHKFIGQKSELNTKFKGVRSHK